MTLLEKIKSDAFEARKSHKNDTLALLTTLYSEASMVGKNNGNRESTDAEVLQVVEKFVKNAKEVRDLLLKSGKDANHIIAEIDILSVYLPEKLSQHDLEIIIKRLVGGLDEKSPKQMGKVMALLKERFNGHYDGKMASGLVKKALS